MAQFGKITNYDTTTGAGFIMPEKGGARLPFARADLLAGAKAPAEKDRYEYETGSETDGEARAVKLRRA